MLIPLTVLLKRNVKLEELPANILSGKVVSFAKFPLVQETEEIIKVSFPVF